jgi:hypothetical protein
MMHLCSLGNNEDEEPFIPLPFLYEFTVKNTGNVPVLIKGGKVKGLLMGDAQETPAMLEDLEIQAGSTLWPMSLLVRRCNWLKM